MKLIQDLEIKPGARVLIRCDLNLPQDESGKFTDFFRLESSLPTLDYLLDLEATVFITAHLGSPKGKVDSRLSLRTLAPILQDQLDVEVQFIEDPFDLSLNLKSKKGVFLIENLRFWPGEEAADLDFAKDLINSTGAETFIQDAFGVVHREHASLVRFPEILPSAAGILLQKEVQFLSEPEIENLSLIVGGAKVESKLPVISNFIGKANSVLTGGVVANTFLEASGENIASSLFEETCLDLAEEISSKAKKSDSELGSKTDIILPEDYLTSTSSDSLLAQEADKTNLQEDQFILDLGQKTIDTYKSRLNYAKTVIWAGTLGFAENPVFAGASKQILQHLLELKSSNADLKIIIGGGDTVDFTRDQLEPNELDLITHLSTGGGASLRMLSGQKLPGIVALSNLPDVDSTTYGSEHEREAPEVPNPTPTSTIGSKTPMLIANLKSHFNLREVKDWLSEVLKSETLTSPALNFCIAPSSIFLEELNSDIQELKLKNPPEIFAQDISESKEGPETGEVSASQLQGIASGTLVGHSERRNLLHESNEVISEKLQRALESKLKIILCVGGGSKEDLAQKREVAEQLKSAIVSTNSLTSHYLTIAYEPVFAIGSGDVPTPEFLASQLQSIRIILNDYGLESKVLYGGSVTPDNAKELLGIGFNGLLVGSASLKPESLEAIGINISA